MRRKITLIFLLIAYPHAIHTFGKVDYTFSADPIDVVIPCHNKDAAHLNVTIDSIRQYVDGIRKIIVISSEKFTDNAEWIDEKIFPFNKENIALEIFKSQSLASYQLSRPDSRIGWIYQQFLKLFAAYYIPNISSNILIVDSDVIFLKPVTFIQENGAGLYAVRDTCYALYFEHISRLLPTVRQVFPKCSGVAHHMLFQKPVLDDLLRTILKENNLEPWIAIAQSIKVTNNEIPSLVMSEYELYFNFVFSRTDQVKIRHLRWKDVVNTTLSNQEILEKPEIKELDFVAVHVRPHQNEPHLNKRAKRSNPNHKRR